MSNYYVAVMPDGSVLCHHGIKGQKWGVRRYQREDGTWTEEGLQRRRSGDGGWQMKQYQDRYDRNVSKGAKARTGLGKRYRESELLSATDQITARGAIKESKSAGELMSNLFGRTGTQKLYDGRARAAADMSKAYEENGKMKDAIRTAAASKNYKRTSDRQEYYLSSKSTGERLMKELDNFMNDTDWDDDVSKYYTNVGRERVSTMKSDLTALLTLGVSEIVADRRYVKSTSAEERLAKLRG